MSAAKLASSVGRGLTGFGRGSVKLLRPAVLPIAALGGGSLLVNQIGRVADDVGKAVNPPIERIPVDPNGDGVPDAWVLFDRKTGLLNTWGQPPANTQENDRQEVQKWTLALVGLGVVGVVVVLTAGRR